MEEAMRGVKEFTEQSSLSGKLPTHPRAISPAQAHILVKFILDEVYEFLWATEPGTDVKKTITDILEKDVAARDDLRRPVGDKELISDQADALVDTMYYMMNCAAKHGMNLARIFDVVQAANLAKGELDPATGKRKYIIRESDGKVMKPPGWQPANVDGCIEEMINNSSWE
jgi:predicted HAD superfamily Cof-like phosphohydrolase